MGKDEVQQRKIQKKGRVDVPDEFWEGMSLKIGDGILVVDKKDRIEIRPATADQIK